MTGMPGFSGLGAYLVTPIPTPPAYSASYLVVNEESAPWPQSRKDPPGTQARTRRQPPETKFPAKIDPNAPAGSENSLGAESVRDGRPATDDSTVEAMDEESPDITGTLDTDSGR